jgi:hypothetical protein
VLLAVRAVHVGALKIPDVMQKTGTEYTKVPRKPEQSIPSSENEERMG